MKSIYNDDENECWSDKWKIPHFDDLNQSTLVFIRNKRVAKNSRKISVGETASCSVFFSTRIEKRNAFLLHAAHALHFSSHSYAHVPMIPETEYDIQSPFKQTNGFTQHMALLLFGTTLALVSESFG